MRYKKEKGEKFIFLLSFYIVWKKYKKILFLQKEIFNS